MREFNSVAELQAARGEHLGYSDWHLVSQDQINLFAEATGDHQWIHVDEARAAAGPFGGTIAHGFLTLSLIPQVVSQVYRVNNTRMGINYGLNKVRFPAPLRSGTRARGGITLLDVAEVEAGCMVTANVTIEGEGAAKPACVAEVLALFSF